MQNSPGNSRGSLSVIFLTVFIDLLGFGIIMPLLPLYARQFITDGSGWVIALLMAIYSIMQFLVTPLWGRLSDRVGRRPVLIVGLSGSVIFYMLFAIASVMESLPLLFVSRIGAGIAGATISTAHAYIADTTTLENRNKGMALIGAAFGLGFTFGPLVGAMSLWNLGADDSPGGLPGYIAAGLSVIALLMAIFVLPESLNQQTSAPRSDRRRRTWLDTNALAKAIVVPSMSLLLLTTFLTVVAFGVFESTLSLLLKDNQHGFGYAYKSIFWIFAYIGLVLTIAQGAIVRRLAGRVAEAVLAASGSVIMIGGLLLLNMAQHVNTDLQTSAQGWLLAALAVCVCGFALITPSLNSLISRRSNPQHQGSVLGLSQSISSLARIIGPLVGIPLFHHGVKLPMWAGVVLLVFALVLVLFAGRRGKDYEG